MAADRPGAGPATPLATIAGEWSRIGVTGFGGPPAHIALLRRLCVVDRAWLSEDEFEDGVAATNLLPGPASTQLAIFCAWRRRGAPGAVIGGLGFILPGLVVIVALSALFFGAHPPRWVRGAAGGAAAAVPIVAVRAAAGLVPSGFRRAGDRPAGRARWMVYLVAGAAAAIVAGPWLAAVLAGCGLLEVRARRTGPSAPGRRRTPPAAVAAVAALAAPAVGGLAALTWVALKVGLLSYGGGFVIVPLMQHDAVHAYHWMTGTQFLDAVALGQVTPGPVVLTVSAVGYAAAGVPGALLGALVAFTPSFVFVLVGGRHLGRLRRDPRVQAFLTGAGAAAIGAIAGSAVPLALALTHLWQVGVLAGAAVWLLAARRGTVAALVAAAGLGVVAALAGAPLG